VAFMVVIVIRFLPIIIVEVATAINREGKNQTYEKGIYYSSILRLIHVISRRCL
jgi:hypothetical protein